MAVTEPYQWSGMSLWPVVSALFSASLSCVAFLARFVLVFADELGWLDLYLRWVSYLAFAAVPLLLILGLFAARKKSDDMKQRDPRR